MMSIHGFSNEMCLLNDRSMWREQRIKLCGHTLQLVFTILEEYALL